MSQEAVRPDWSLWFMRLAYVVAQRGSCRRKRVGAIIIDPDHRIISTGYNGAPSGQPDCLEHGCDIRVIDGRESCVRTLHAESNAIDHAGVRCKGATLVTTVMPCRLCALRIVQAGFASVTYHEDYKIHDGVYFIRSAGIRAERLDVPLSAVVGNFDAA